MRVLQRRISPTKVWEPPSCSSSRVALSWPWRARRSTHTILGIETSCDDTGVALVDYRNRRVVEEMVSSQFQTHAPWKGESVIVMTSTQAVPFAVTGGIYDCTGVVPAMAARDHQINLPTVLEQILQRALHREKGLKIDAVAATAGPGLALCLKTGFLTGKMIAQYLDVPFIPVHHMAAHALVCRLEDPTITYPFLTMLISGGHTMIVLVEALGNYQVLASTLDDSIGEAIDKAARVLRVGIHQHHLISTSHYDHSKEELAKARGAEGRNDNRFDNFFPTFSSKLPDSYDPPVTTHYGVLLEKLAAFGNPHSFDMKVPLERETASSSRKKELRKKRQVSKLAGKGAHSSALDGIHQNIQFSFSGLKTKVLQLSTSKCDPTDFNDAANLAATFQRVTTEHLTQQLRKAIEYCIKQKGLDLNRIVVAGGVAANSYIRQAIEDEARSMKVKASFPSLRYCTDNGTMIAWAAAEDFGRSDAETVFSSYQEDYSDFSSRWPLGAPVPRRNNNHTSEVLHLRSQQGYESVLSHLEELR
eukprot:gb/GECG01007703.1/.p1 GENE.gb/GECG01007703.1/~~gb/GECG01007703.1/.p1  ORF type:complete len:532 (+),score=47.58 gb/GECG01007703.1/:1-1596(+)